MFSFQALDGADVRRIPAPFAVSAVAGLCEAVAGARSVALTAYRLEDGVVARALEAAAERGASVSVELDGRPYDPRRPGSGSEGEPLVADRLRSHGVTVRFTAPESEPLHMKSALVDGVLYLDDRNFSGDGRDLIVRCDDPGAIARRPDFATTKGAALALESRAIADSGRSVDVESESFGPGAVARLLEAKARRGDGVRLVVAARDLAGPSGARERRLLERMARAGVHIRIGDSDEKLAVGARAAWVGSANATSGRPGTVDWGLLARGGQVAAAARAHFDANWERAAPFN